ncbi:MAG: hypothetical protein IKZ21_04705, partial [Clostridia bacterium]|nr:hypothetical protein [Clostridia bacterium]
VMGIQDPVISDTFYNVKVNFVGEDTLRDNKRLTVMERVNQSVNVRLSGKRSDIMKVIPENIYVEADLSKISSAGPNAVQCTVTPPDSALTVENLSSVRASVVVDFRDTKAIPVRLVYSTDLNENEIVGEKTLSPDVITITGAQSELDTIEFAYVKVEEPVSDSYYEELPYVLTDSSGNLVETEYVVSSTDKVNVSIPVLLQKTIPLNVHILEGGGMTGDNVEVDINPNQVTVAGERSVVEGMTELVIGEINLGAVESSSTATQTIDLGEGLTNISQVTSATVKYTLVNVSEKTMIIPTSSISVINAPEGFTVNLAESDIQIKLAGGNAVLSGVKEENVAMVVDLKGITAVGEYSVDVEVTFEDLTVTPELESNYKVTVKLGKEKESE